MDTIAYSLMFKLGPFCPYCYWCNVQFNTWKEQNLFIVAIKGFKNLYFPKHNNMTRSQDCFPCPYISYPVVEALCVC